jgi:hypothetical protein
MNEAEISFLKNLLNDLEKLHQQEKEIKEKIASYIMELEIGEEPE